MQFNALASNGVAFADRRHDGARAYTPDITCAEYWSGACVVATIWLIFILYAASRGLG